MTRERPPIQVPAIPEYLLAYFRACHRREATFGDADPDFELMPETTIEDWTFESFMPVGRKLARGLEACWPAGRPWGEWKAVLEPRKERTLGGLCAFLAASGARRPAFEPIGFLGARPCAAAGAFAAVRSILRDAGADADAIEPSTLLEPYLRRHIGAFVHPPLATLAPGALPEHTRRTCRPLQVFVGVCVALMAAPIPALLLSMRFGDLAALIGLGLLAAFPLLFGGVLASFAIDRRFHLARYELGDLRTFKDLARALALAAEK